MVNSDIRKQVLAQIIDVMASADAVGQDTVKAAEFAFPGTPSDVIYAAWVEFESAKTEAWWQTIERTIDSEVIRRALAPSDGGAE